MLFINQPHSHFRPVVFVTAMTMIRIVLFLLLLAVVASGNDDITSTGTRTTGNNDGLRTPHTSTPAEDQHTSPRDLQRLASDPKSVVEKKTNEDENNGKHLRNNQVATQVKTGPTQADLYRHGAEQVYLKKKQHCNNVNVNVNVGAAVKCLNQTTPNLMLQYPSDAEAHFRDIRKVMAPWAQHGDHTPHVASGYSGPWIENHWISHFERLYNDSDDSTCLSDHFGAYIPLFLPWVDHVVNNYMRYPDGFLEALHSVLRPNVPYITVSQNAEGLHTRTDISLMSDMPNVIVLSGGGYGHIPVPLIKQEEKLNNLKPVEDRQYDISYVGSMSNAPGDMREHVGHHLSGVGNMSYFYHYGSAWRDIMAESHFSLAPRGFGRTSYHLVEALQMGLIPIHVYIDTDIPWVPYANLFDSVGFVSDSSDAGLDHLVSELGKLTTAEIAERERRIETLRDTHFSIPGVMNQIQRFMVDQENDLQCQALPRTTRAAK
jgi:hypothetical protein